VLVSLPVLLETEWVLRRRYGVPPETILGLFRAALEARELAFEDEAAVEEALFNWQDSQSGFSDCLIVAHNRQLGCRLTATFDAQAAACQAHPKHRQSCARSDAFAKMSSLPSLIV